MRVEFTIFSKFFMKKNVPNFNASNDNLRLHPSINNGTTPTPPELLTIAHFNGTLQWYPSIAFQSWSLPSPHHSTLHGTLQWHPPKLAATAHYMTPCNLHHDHLAKVGPHHSTFKKTRPQSLRAKMTTR